MLVVASGGLTTFAGACGGFTGSSDSPSVDGPDGSAALADGGDSDGVIADAGPDAPRSDAAGMWACPSSSPCNHIVVTTRAYTGDFALLADGGTFPADQLCEKEAAEAGHPGRWTAWVCQSSGAAVKNRAKETVYYKPDGTLALDRTDGAGIIHAPIDLDFNGAFVGKQYVWTACTSSGNALSGSGSDIACSGWNSAKPIYTGAVGSTGTLVDDDWTEDSKQTCNLSAYLYCLEN